MVFGWLTERRRARLVAEPFPSEWDRYIDDNVRLVQRLTPDERTRLRQLVQVFVAEKNWEGCGGLEITDEIKVTIAAQACLLIVGREHALFADVESILVYPALMKRPDGIPILGEAHLRGPTILAWNDVLEGGRGQGRRNLVVHELAHKIDMVDGTIDGTPPLDREGRRTWREVCSEVFLELRERVEDGKKTFLDEYGATNEAEFFAVASEAFFMQPHKLLAKHPELFDVLLDFYRFDPRPGEQPVPRQQP